MTEPIGRKSIKEALKELKVLADCKLKLYKMRAKWFLEDLAGWRDNLRDQEDRLQALKVLGYCDDANDVIQVFEIYVKTLESYLSELDETFDKIFEEAKKMAEEQVKRMPEDRPDFYR